jgi:hypothetical protein
MNAQAGQSVIDLAIMSSGSAEGIFSFCLQNNLSITQRIKAGKNLIAAPVQNNRVSERLQQLNIASAAPRVGSSFSSDFSNDFE